MSPATAFKDFVTEQAPLAGRTWLAVGGPAAYFAEPTSREELVSLVEWCAAEEVPVKVLGGGSNVLVRDAGFPGVVISLAAPAFAEIGGSSGTLTAGGGAALASVVSESVRLGLSGLDALVGIPGTLGGALHSNAGSKGGDIGQWTCEATVLTRAGEVLTRRRDDLIFAYRQSSLDELVILDARFELEEEDPDLLTKRMQKHWIVKKASQPNTGQQTACIFRNPRGMSAGMLIDQAGLKGEAVGGAEVSRDHANYFVTTDGATSDDVQKLIDLVRSRVAERLGVELETELEIW
ncbi:MAG: UDP-N-acetylmuramate dehydrogenase [Planctomycetota bacterium]